MTEQCGSVISEVLVGSEHELIVRVQCKWFMLTDSSCKVQVVHANSSCESGYHVHVLVVTSCSDRYSSSLTYLLAAHSSGRRGRRPAAGQPRPSSTTSRPTGRWVGRTIGRG